MFYTEKLYLRMMKALEESIFHWLYDIYIPLMNGAKIETIFAPGTGHRMYWIGSTSEVPAYTGSCAVCTLSKAIREESGHGMQQFCDFCPLSIYFTYERCDDWQGNDNDPSWKKFAIKKNAYYAMNMINTLQRALNYVRNDYEHRVRDNQASV